MPQSEDLDAAGLCVDLVVEVVAGTTQEEAPDPLAPLATRPCPDSRLGSDQLERAFEILDEGRGCVGPIGTPPGRRSPDLRSSAARRLEDQPLDQGLLAKLPEELLGIHELPLRGFLQRFLECGLLVGCQLEGLVGFGDEDGHRGSLLERITVEL